MKRHRISSVLLLVSLACALTAPLAWAQSSSPKDQPSMSSPGRQVLAEELMRKSGVWSQLDGMGPRVLQGLDQSLQATQPPPPAEVARLRRSALAAYDPALLRESVSRALADQLPAADAESLLAWFDSPLGQTFGRLDDQASADTRPAEQVLDDGLALYRSAPPARQALLVELIRVTRAANVGANLAIHAAIGVRQGVMHVSQSQDIASSAPELRASLESQRTQLEERFVPVFVASLAGAYRSVSDDELARYIDVLARPAGARYMNLALVAMDQALLQAAGRFAHSLAQLPGG